MLETRNISFESSDPVLVNIYAATLLDAALLRWEQSLVGRKKIARMASNGRIPHSTQYETTVWVGKKITKH